jgi:hypothetical protein
VEASACLTDLADVDEPNKLPNSDVLSDCFGVLTVTGFAVTFAVVVVVADVEAIGFVVIGLGGFGVLVLLN